MPAIFPRVESDPVASASLSSHAAATLNVHGTGTVVTSDNIGTYAPAPDLSTLVTLSPASSARNVILSQAAGVVPLTARGAASQTGDLQQWQNNTGTVLARVASSGEIFAAIGLSAQGVAYLADGLFEANSAGYLRFTGSNTSVVPVAFKAASGSATDIQQWQDSAAGVLGRVTATGSLRGTGIYSGEVSLHSNGTSAAGGSREWHFGVTSDGAGRAIDFTRSGVAGRIRFRDNGDIDVVTAGRGLRLLSPDGLTTRTLTIDNAGALVVA